MPAATMSTSPPMLPFRDSNNLTLRYAPASTTSATSYSPSPYDSDCEALISSSLPSDIDEEAMMRFTATGRPAPVFKASGLQNLGGHMYTAPQLLPKRYTDESVIPAIVTNVIPRARVDGSGAGAGKEKKAGGFLKKLKGAKRDEVVPGGSAEAPGIMKVVYMPRGEYLKYFAKDLKGEYIGTEPYRRYTEEELEERYQQYIPRNVPKKRWGSS